MDDAEEEYLNKEAPFSELKDVLMNMALNSDEAWKDEMVFELYDMFYKEIHRIWSDAKDHYEVQQAMLEAGIMPEHWKKSMQPEVIRYA